MTKYVLLYTAVGAQATVAPTPEEQQASLAAWNTWFEGMGDRVVDAGNPFGPSKTLATDGTASDGATSRVTGYSVIEADSLETATALAKGCPNLSDGGGVEIYETFTIM
ncbi:MAG TPA: YciI family protein [Ktedonobacterales bacterium]|jgi:hypothetical protein|nr:YciI family protein [Ktedonobacterales bacterium]